MAADQAQATDLQPSFYFELDINGVAADCAFQEVSGLEKEMDIEEVTSGGENRFRFRLPKGLKSSNLVLKRGVTQSGSRLVQWCHETLDGGFGEAIRPKDIRLTLLNPDGLPAMTWTFKRAWPVKWSFSELKSQENALLIETIELAYQTGTPTGRGVSA